MTALDWIIVALTLTTAVAGYFQGFVVGAATLGGFAMGFFFLLRLVQQGVNPRLGIDGVLLTMYDARLNLSRQVAADAREYFDDQVFETLIPRNIRLAEAPSFGQSIFQYAPNSPGADDYRHLAQEVLKMQVAEVTPPAKAVRRAA